jgi:WD40 repeat protein
VKLSRYLRSALVALFLVLTLVTTSACSAAPTADRSALPSSNAYGQLERGDTAAGQDFGNWVVQTANGLVQDAYVRDNDKLGVVISPQVRPNEVRPLARSLVQGFHHNFPDRDVSVLVYAPDKKLILTANYDQTTRQVEYQ